MKTVVNFLFSKNEKCVNYGLLVLRIILGGLFIYHGSGKMFSPEKWAFLGSQFKLFGANFIPSFWGFMASASEFLGGFCIILGLGFRIANFFLFCTMAVAISFHMGKGDSFSGFELPFFYAACFVALFIAGPGCLGLDQKLCKCDKKR